MAPLVEANTLVGTVAIILVLLNWYSHRSFGHVLHYTVVKVQPPVQKYVIFSDLLVMLDCLVVASFAEPGRVVEVSRSDTLSDGGRV